MLSVKLDVAEDSTRKEIAYGSIVEIDAIMKTAVDLEYVRIESLQKPGILLNESFAMLSKSMEQTDK